MGKGPDGAGPGEAGISSVQAGLGSALSLYGCMLRGAGSGATAGRASAAAMAGAGFAKSAPGAECCTPTVGVCGAEGCWFSMAALLVNGSCSGLTDRGRGSLKGLVGGGTALAAPGRSHALNERSSEAAAVAGAASDGPPVLLPFPKTGSNCVTGRRLRRGAVDMVRCVLMLGAGSEYVGGAGSV
jgi:hypothetical protein